MINRKGIDKERKEEDSRVILYPSLRTYRRIDIHFSDTRREEEKEDMIW